jgi:hypothetical protein
VLTLLLVYGGIAVVAAVVMLIRGWGWRRLWLILFWPFVLGGARSEVWRDIWMRDYRPK